MTQCVCVLEKKGGGGGVGGEKPKEVTHGRPMKSGVRFGKHAFSIAAYCLDLVVN